MAFPTVPTSGNGRLLSTVQQNTTATRTFPDLSSLTKTSGDLLIAIIVAYQTTATSNAAFGTWGGSFTEFVDQSTSTTMAIGAAYKFSTGSETGTFTVTQAATVSGEAAMFLLAVTGNHASTPPEATAIANGTAAAADPAALSPSWGADDTLWIAVAGNGETNTAGAWDGLTTAPTNYSNTALAASGTDVVGSTDGGVAFRQNNTASEDVGTWTQDLSNARNSALTIAVRPPPSLTTDAIPIFMPHRAPPMSSERY
jgi:hypothetical protein